jgi:hypothetical protein
MPGQYDYSINIPQPPAQNFLQSLTGIMQLKGLQQQGEIAQQQAQFAQQMQPLQIEAERARINQIGQATAASAEALKGARLQNEQLQRQSDFQKELVNFTSKPVEQWSESEVRSIAARGAAINPKATEGVINFWASQPKPEKTLVDDAAMKAGIAIAQNRPDVAKSIVDQAKLDAEKLGFTTALKFLDFGGSQLDQDPALAYATILGHFGTDKTKLDQLVTASELKGKLEETQAKTKKAEAEAITTKQEKQVDEQKAELEREKLKLGNQKLQQEIDAARDAEVNKFASENKEGYKLKAQADSQVLQAQKAKDILQTIDSLQSQLPKNIGQSFVQYLRDKVPAYSNDISFLRTQYEALVAPEAKKNLPPGSASDADMREARKGITSRNATPEQFRKAVELIARETENQAKYTEAKLAWMSKNRGSVGSAVRDLNIFGSNVPKGASLSAWWSKVGKNLDPYAMPSEASPAAAGGNPTDVDSILKRFGVPQ